MLNRWNAAEAALRQTPLELRAYSSRLIGVDPALVLHGGGNTSVKTRETDLFGREFSAIWVKASGFDLGKMGVEGFTGLEIAPLLELAELPRLSDSDMVREVRRAQIDPAAANASIEAIVHAVIPAAFVDHSHADAILTISNSTLPEGIWAEVLGPSVAVLPYVKPGFDLARQILAFHRAGGFERHDAIVLEHHGLFTWHDEAKASYDRHIDLVAQAQAWLEARFGKLEPGAPLQEDPLRLARLRRAVGRAAGGAVISQPSAAIPAELVERIGGFTRQGTVTPEHVIHNKPFPALLSEDPEADLAGFAAEYRAYFDRAEDPALIPLPNFPHWSIAANGAIRSYARNLKRAEISADVARTTARALLYAEKAGGWRGLSEEDLRGLEYWELEQAKLRRLPADPPLAGKIALVTGAAAGIGRAIAETLHKQGAVVVGLDLNPAVTERLKAPGLLGLVADAADPAALTAAVAQVVGLFGGLDVVVSNVGIFTAGSPVEEMDPAVWEKSMRINLDAHLHLARATIPLLRHGFDPSFLIIASRNVPAPGPGAAAYSVAKAGLTQLMRVMALELAADHVTVNALHPDAVFDTELWTEEALARSAARYGLSVEEYKRRNLMKAPVRSSDVAEAALALVGGFRRTTGAQIPVDGGNDRVI